MDAVYIVKQGASSWADNELRYSIRSLKNIKFDKLWIVGHKPDFIDCNHIKCDDPYEKQSNAIHKILKVCDSQISDDFILLNDDFLFLEPQELVTYHREPDLREFGKELQSKYGQALKNAFEYLATYNLGYKNYEVHYPMVFNKTKFKELFSKIDYINKPMTYRSIYGNYYKLDSQLTEDFKAFTQPQVEELKRGKFLSTDNPVVRNMFFVKWLNRKFPEPSNFEVK